MRFLLSTFFVAQSLLCFAQQTTVDSLLTIINEKKVDAETFNALKKLGSISEKQEPLKAIAYYRHALEFPFRTVYAKGFVNVCNDLADLYHNRGRYDSSFLLGKQALILARKMRLEKEAAEAYQIIGLNFLRTSYNDSARVYFKQALDVFSKLKEVSLEAGAYVSLGNVFLDERNYPESVNYFIKAANLFEGPANDSTGLARAWLNIANIQNILGQYEQALDYVQRAVVIARRKKNDSYLAYCNNLSGRIFRKLKRLDNALLAYENALAIYSEREDIRNEAEVIYAIGNVYSDQNQFEKAIGTYKRSLALSRKIEAPSQLTYTFSAMGQAYFKLRNHSLALVYIDSSFALARIVKNKYLEMDAYATKGEIYSDQKKFDQAFFFLGKYAALRDTITQEENRQATSDLEAKYQNTKKNAEIELLRKDRELQSISLKQSRTLQAALIAAFVLLAVIGLLVFNRSRMIHQSNRQMEIEKVRNQIARDLHDDMGSTLSSINLISQVALQEKPSGLQEKYFQRISDQSTKMMESMSDMVWSINPDNDNFQKTLAKMKEFSAEILEPKNVDYQFDVDETLNEISLDVAKRKNLFLVFKEAINNAAKYSECSLINISLSKTVNELLLTIQDNGKGFDISSPTHGNGLHNMRARANEINADISLESTVGHGTSLILKMPLT
jgi:signal transduction histidine kinase